DDPVVATADRLVGLAGPYDIVQLGVLAAPLFGVAPSADPDLWASGNPMALIGPETDLAVLLLHGSDDTVVSVRFSESFAEALESAGSVVDLAVLDEVTHMTVTDPAMVGDALLDWLAEGRDCARDNFLPSGSTSPQVSTKPVVLTLLVATAQKTPR